jgi:redox-sensitive bicupin YhaK (pirin superfamily)
MIASWALRRQHHSRRVIAMALSGSTNAAPDAAPDSAPGTATNSGVASALGLVFRPAAERFHSRLDWLDSWHSFSFSSHHDPAWMGFGPLRVINDDTIAAGRGFGMHPHRDMEIVTVMVEGQLNHCDSMGHAEVLRAGEVQRMSAGTGVVHSEINQGERACRLLQIWIEPSSAGIDPAYEQKPFAIGSGWTSLLDPAGADGAMAIHRPVRLWRARPEAGDRLALPLAAGSRGWLQLIDGSLACDGLPERLQRGDGLGFIAGEGPVATLSSAAPGTDLLLFELR